MRFFDKLYEMCIGTRGQYLGINGKLCKKTLLFCIFFVMIKQI